MVEILTMSFVLLLLLLLLLVFKHNLYKMITDNNIYNENKYKWSEVECCD